MAVERRYFARWFDGEDGEHKVASHESISKTFARQDELFIETEPFDERRIATWIWHGNIGLHAGATKICRSFHVRHDARRM